MTKKTKDKAPEISIRGLSYALLLSSDPIPVRKFRAMIKRLVRLEQEIIELADPEMCRTLLPWVTSCLGDLLDSLNQQSSASHKLEGVLKAFARKKATIGR
jgi:hypothetical protein